MHRDKLDQVHVDKELVLSERSECVKNFAVCSLLLICLVNLRAQFECPPVHDCHSRPEAMLVETWWALAKTLIRRLLEALQVGQR
jgi:hypothetical protein